MLESAVGGWLRRLEEDEKLVLTPFEKNIEVWRQLWRVLERSDIVVQVPHLSHLCDDNPSRFNVIQVAARRTGSWRQH